MKKKKLRIDREADGKQELDYGSEELDKEQVSLSVNRINQEEVACEGEDQDKKKTKESENKHRDVVIKAIHDRWNLLKAKLNSDEAIMDLTDAQSTEEENPAEDEEKLEGGLADGASEEEFDPQQLEMGIKVEMEHTNNPEEAKEIAMDHLKEDPEYYTKLAVMESEGAEQGEMPPEEPAAMGAEQGEMPPEEQAAMGAEQGEMPPEEGQLEEEQAAAEQITEQAEEQGANPEEALMAFAEHLKEQGYSDSEIAYIIHGHAAPQVDPVDQSKIDMNSAKMEADRAAAERDGAMKEKSAEMEAMIREQEAEMDRAHKQRMNDHMLQTEQEKAKIHNIEIDHKQRMLDLEYEKAQNENELDLEFKRKELELKLKNKEQAARDKDARTTEHPRTTKKELEKAIDDEPNKLTPTKITPKRIISNFDNSQDSLRVGDRIKPSTPKKKSGIDIWGKPKQHSWMDKKEKEEDVSVKRPDSSTPQSDLPNYGFSKDEDSTAVVSPKTKRSLTERFYEAPIKELMTDEYEPGLPNPPLNPPLPKRMATKQELKELKSKKKKGKRGKKDA